jgi:hypothetical protein
MICRNKGVPSDLLLEIQNTLSLGGGGLFSLIWTMIYIIEIVKIIIILLLMESAL